MTCSRRPLRDIASFIARYQWYLTPITFLLVAVSLWRQGRRGRSPVETVDELQAELATAELELEDEATDPRPRPEPKVGGAMEPPCSHLHMIHDVDAQRRRLRGLPAHRRHLGAPAPVPHVRSRRLLRPVEEHARDQALPRRAPPADPVVRTRRELAVVLRRRGDDGTRLSDAEDVHRGHQRDRRRPPAHQATGHEHARGSSRAR